MLIISFTSIKKDFTSVFDMSVSSINLNQYLVSPASLAAIHILAIKSFFVCAACASSTFAPILVPELKT